MKGDNPYDLALNFSRIYSLDEKSTILLASVINKSMIRNNIDIGPPSASNDFSSSQSAKTPSSNNNTTRLKKGSSSNESPEDSKKKEKESEDHSVGSNEDENVDSDESDVSVTNSLQSESLIAGLSKEELYLLQLGAHDIWDQEPTSSDEDFHGEENTSRDAKDIERGDTTVKTPGKEYDFLET